MSEVLSDVGLAALTGREIIAELDGLIGRSNVQRDGVPFALSVLRLLAGLAQATDPQGFTAHALTLATINVEAVADLKRTT